MANFNRTDWLVLSGLIGLSFIPVVAGMVRLSILAYGGPITPGNARFFEAPSPVVMHILSVTVYCLLGAFQFTPGFRRKWPEWHSTAGRVLVVAGLIAALSGLWMAMFYEIVPADNVLLRTFRLFFGAAMTLSIALGYLAIRRRDLNDHQKWMRRACAIGLGAGTQAATQLPIFLMFGQPSESVRAVLMGMAWVLNLGVAEYLIRRQPSKVTQAVPDGLFRMPR
jgi:uncharacterized membrane protein